MNTEQTYPLYLSLGSNLGDREENIKKALDALSEAFGVPPVKVSALLETRPEGFDSPHLFLNAAARFDIKTAEPRQKSLEILDICKCIEKRLGRTDGEERGNDGKRIYHDRPIDIDLLLFGDLEMDSPRLTLPHPRMAERDFVQIPLREIM